MENPNIITALKLQKHNKNRASVFLNGEYVFAVSLKVADTLRKGQILSESEIEYLKAEGEQQLAYERALRFLGYRARSQKEMVEYLQGKEYSPVVIDDTIARLVAENYLDDEAFARLWLSDRERFHPRGSRALQYELQQKGISDEIIHTVLADCEDESSAWLAVKPKLRQWKNLERMDFQKKVMGFLNRRGFDYETCRQVCDRAWSIVLVA
jgi:regulatory protein